MPTGAAFRFTAADGPLTSANLNGMDDGGNVYRTAGQDLQVDVSALSYVNLMGANPTAGAYAGTTGQAVTDNATTYLYLGPAGTLLTSTSAFPDPQTTAHIPLAEVTASGGVITGVTDRRPRLRLGNAAVPSYTVSALPSATGRWLAFATNGRKTGEGGGAGTGVLCYHDGTAWRRVDDGTTAAA